jgi:putative aldouronate transport system permease protein
VIFFAICCLLPFWLVISGSLTDEKALINNGYTLWPQKFSLDSYQFLLAGGQVVTSYGISIIITVVGTALAVAITSSLAYAIAMLRPRTGRALGFFVYFPMLFSGGLVPFYLLITQGLQLQDSLWAVILPLMVNPFFVFIMVSFFRQIPREIIESGRIDGANSLVIFVRLVLPISTPVLATIALFYALTYWNDWFMALLFISDNTKFPLQLLLQNMIANVDATQSLQYNSAIQVPSYQLRMALTLITIGPIIFVYPFLQRYFVKGLTLGAAKG